MSEFLFFMLCTLIAFILFIYLFLALPVYYFKKKRKERDDLIFAQISEFSVVHKHYGKKMLVALDRELKNICLIDLNNIPKGEEHGSKHTFKYLKAEDIMKVELFEDGNSVTSSSRSIGGALIGGALFGGIGAVVGGLGGSSKNTATVNKIEIRLTINDKVNPIYDIDFLDGEINKDQLAEIYNNISKQARVWYGYFEVMLKNVKDTLDESKESQDDLLTKLEKLNILKTSNTISEDEFELLKKDLLNRL